MTSTEFITGESNPQDFTAEAVTDHLEVSDAAEVERVQLAEVDGKQRKSVLEWERSTPGPTDPSLETLANQPPAGPSEEPDAEPVPAVEGPQVGDVLEVPDLDDDGYTRVVISTDGAPTEATEAAVAAEPDAPVVYA